MAENDFGVAIIGMAGRFPQADTVQAFWENLLASRECISFYSDEELLAMGISPEFVQHPDYVKAKGRWRTSINLMPPSSVSRPERRS